MRRLRQIDIELAVESLRHSVIVTAGSGSELLPTLANALGISSAEVEEACECVGIDLIEQLCGSPRGDFFLGVDPPRKSAALPAWRSS